MSQPGKLRYFFLIPLAILFLGVVVYFMMKPDGDSTREVASPQNEKPSPTQFVLANDDEPYPSADYLLELPGDIKMPIVFLGAGIETLSTFKKVTEYDAEGCPQKDYTFEDGQITTSIDGDGSESICFVDIRGPGIKTNRGVVVGDDVNQVREKYGVKPNSISNYSDNKYTYNYQVKEYIAGSLVEEDISFGFLDHKVNAILFTGIYPATP